MNEAKSERRENYGYGAVITTRWGDIDSYGHVNNAVYYSWFDTVIGRMLVERKMIWPLAGHAIGLCVASACEFFAPVHFGDEVEARVRIARVGASSLRYEIGLFTNGRPEPVAAGHFVHVFVDQATRLPLPLSDVQKQAVADLVVPGL